MSADLDTLLTALSRTPSREPALEGIEHGVWTKVAAADHARAEERRSLRLQVAVGAVTLILGLGIGWTVTGGVQSDHQSMFAVSDEGFGPLARLSTGL